MARDTFESKGWLPEETDSSVIQAIASTSVIERIARVVPMSTATKNVARTGSVGVSIVPKGGAYPEDTSEQDEVTLSVVKFGTEVVIAEEDLEDSPHAILEIKKGEWASSYARYIDNACLGVTAARGAGVPFTSVYRALSQADTATGYVANAGITKTAGPLTYEALSQALAKRETGRYYDRSKEVVIADFAVRALLREIKDGNGKYIFADSPRVNEPDTLFGFPIEWSAGARTSATATDEPNGNPLVIFGNRDHLLLGKRSGPESVVIDGRDGRRSGTDETVLKMRARRAFTIAHPKAFSILEITPAG